MGRVIICYIKYKDNTRCLELLNKLEAIEDQHHNPQQWSNQNRPHASSSYGREDHRNGRTQAVTKTYVSENNDVREILGALNRKITTYKRNTGGREVAEGIIRRNMTNASALNAEATPYCRVRNSQENVTDNRTGNCRGTE
jgi:hypothetical protein